MSKIQNMIKKAQDDIQQAGQQLNQLMQQRQQIDQAIKQGENQYNGLIARLNTLQEVASAGDSLFQDGQTQAAEAAAAE